MKTLYVIVLLALLGLAVLSCSDSSNPVVTSVDKTGMLNNTGILDKDDGVLHSATGNAHWKYILLTDETNAGLPFTAILHKDGTVTGDVVFTRGKAKVYDLKVSGNMAKLSFQFTRGNYFADPYGVDISKIFGWLVVIDNGDGRTATGPDFCTLVLYTDGSDIGTQTIEGIDAMSPEEYLQMMKDYILPFYDIPYDDFMLPTDNGNIQVR